MAEHEKHCFARAWARLKTTVKLMEKTLTLPTSINVSWPTWIRRLFA